MLFRSSLYLISGSVDSTIRVWNVQTSEAVGDPLTGHTGFIRSITFASDGHEFASASDDGTISVWDTRVRTDLAMHQEGVKNYTELSEEEFLLRWNTSRACTAYNDGWVKDQEKLLLWVPWQYRHDIKGGTRLVIGARSSDTIRPKVDHRRMLQYIGTRWKDIYIGKGT